MYENSLPFQVQVPLARADQMPSIVLRPEDLTEDGWATISGSHSVEMAQDIAHRLWFTEGEKQVRVVSSRGTLFYINGEFK